MSIRQEIDIAIKAIADTFRFFEDLGCNGFECQATSLQALEKWQASAEYHHETLEVVRQDLGECQRCRLWKRRSYIVFGEGSPNARLMFVGEGPGFDEDQTGKPFVGAAGQLLTKIIQAMQLNRADVYIANIIKCRPPGNRTPLPDEIKTCLPFLHRQIEVIKPQFICTLGSVAAQALLQTKSPISRLRGNWRTSMGIRVMPTYHPAYLLRNPDRKRDVWEDIKLIMKELNI